jgi:tight adherence protein B
MPTSELRFFAIVLAIQQKTGGNLAEALGNLSVVLRARKLMREKIKAMSGEAVASAGIIGVLPPGVMALVTVMTPSYMMVMYTDPRGQMLLAAGGLWMAIGGFIMKRMIDFKF